MKPTAPILDKLPRHLRQFIKPQNYADYSPINQAVWRYVMRKNVDTLQHLAHESYLDGLKQTGIPVDHIPNMADMNLVLNQIGWAVVAVDGFIPPSAFMEFQAYNVLVVASDIRQLEHIEYTPAPDIIHEGAGHAPIIANPEYGEYLRRFGEIGSKAISSEQDFQLYEAVRHLSIIKEAPDTPDSEIKAAEIAIEDLQNNMGDASEMALIRNLHWWTVEYGLIGAMDDLKIYGAGLLSSIGESAQCLTDKVAKRPYTIEAAWQNFDITKPQPQLFVTPDFAHLSLVLEEFANKMALRTGGLKGVTQLITSRQLGTLELSTGLQISGTFSNVISHDNKVAYIQTSGPTALAIRDRELAGHGVGYHAQGFGSPIGKLMGINLAIEDMGPRDLIAYHIYEGRSTRIEFEGGIVVEGEVITGKRNLQGKIVLISFRNCTVTQGDHVLFKPEWGVYDMAVGKEVRSAYAGPADLNSFDMITHVPAEQSIHIKSSDSQIRLEALYQKVRSFREGVIKVLDKEQILETLQQDHPQDWLLSVELYELSGSDPDFRSLVLKYLEQIQSDQPQIQHLVKDGIELIESNSKRDVTN